MTGVRLPQLNLVVLSGRLTKDAEFFVTQSGMSKVTLRLAVSRSVKNVKTGEWKDDAFYVDVVAWKELADRSKDKAKKGAAVLVEGRLASREYDDKSGSKRTVFEIMANRLQFLTMQADAGEGAKSSAAPAAEAESIEEVPF